MLRAVSQAEFLERPERAYVAGAGWLYWCAHPGLHGVSFWGSPRTEDIPPLLALHRASLAPGRMQHACVVDTRRLDGIEPEALSLILGHVERETFQLGRQIRAQALVRGGGMAGMTLAGLQDVLSLPYPAKVFVEPGDALRWLGFVNADEILADVEPVLLTARDGDKLLGRLRVLLDQSTSYSLGTAARALEVAPRTLQRKLQESGTTWHTELSAARMRVASGLLDDPNLSLGVIAGRLGCASAAQFSARFRRATGESPSRFRARRRSVRAA
ncbi:MAG: helix-turn-helix domain-containing protein [Polyangiaceae bacterium]